MTALSTLIEPLKRELAVPGTFDALYPDTTNDDLLGALADAFAQAQLYGWFPDTVCEEQPFVDASPTGDTVDDPGVEDTIHDWLTTPDLSAAGGALIVIYASMAFIRSSLRSINNSERYKAGSVEYEISKAASVMVEELKYLQKRLDDLIAGKDKEANASAGMATVFDNYLARGGLGYCGGFYAYEYH